MPSRRAASLASLPPDALHCIALAVPAALDALAFVCSWSIVLAAVPDEDLLEWRDIVALQRNPRARLSLWKKSHHLGDGNNLNNKYALHVLGTTPSCVRLAKIIGVRVGQAAVIQKLGSFSGNDEGVPTTELRKVALLRRLQKHDNVLAFIDVMHFERVDGARCMHICTEFVEYNLRQYSRLPPEARGSMPPATCIRSLLRQLLAGLAHCHTRCIMHRNLKPQVLRVTPNGVLKIASFGLARMFSDVPASRADERSYTHEVVTLWYRPPEILLGARAYTAAIDMWSVGCILAELARTHWGGELAAGQQLAATGALFPGDSEVDTLFKIFRRLGTPDEAVLPGVSEFAAFSPEFPQWLPRPLRQAVPSAVVLDDLGLDLLSRMLKYDPIQRITASGALEHEYCGVNRA